MEPTRSNALVDLIDRILDKGVILHADIIISVSDIPLIGINLKAAIAGIKTMLDYGMMEAWDETLRRQSCEIEEGEVPLTEDEKIILKTFGEVLSPFGATSTCVWQRGYLYLTNKRLFLFRRRPPKILFEAALDQISEMVFGKSDYAGGKREVLSIALANGVVRLLHSDEMFGLRGEIERVRRSTVSIPVERTFSLNSVSLSRTRRD